MSPDLKPGDKAVVACRIVKAEHDPDSPYPPYYKVHIEGTGLETFSPDMSVKPDPTPILKDLASLPDGFDASSAVVVLRDRAKAWLEGR